MFILTAETRKAMKQMLTDIQKGDYARQWIDENKNGRPWFNGQRKSEQNQHIEQVGARLRELMPFLNPVHVRPDGTVSKPAQSEPQQAKLANAGD